MRAKKKLGNM